LRYQYVLAAAARRSDPSVAHAALADLAVRKAQYVDPLFQSLSGAVTALFFAMVVGGYSVFRWRVAARLAAARRATAG